MDVPTAARVLLRLRQEDAAVAPQPTVLGVPSWSVAVLVSVASSALMVLGLVLQKRAIAAARPWHPRIGEIVLSPVWVMGFLLGVVLPIPLQVIAYSLAPMSLTTPLSGVTVAVNTVFAPRLLGERMQPWPDLPATFVILAGTALTTVAGDHQSTDYTFPELLGLCLQAAFILALVLLIIVIAGSIGIMTRRRSVIEASAKARPGNPDMCFVLLPALVAAGCGCIANIGLKAFGELLQDKADARKCFLWLAIAALPAVAQLNYISRGLRLYHQTVFFPVYNSLLLLTNTAYGLIFYREYERLVQSSARSTVFGIGILLVMLGVCLFARRSSDEDLEANQAAKRALRDDAASGGLDSELGLRGAGLAPPLVDDAARQG